MGDILYFIKTKFLRLFQRKYYYTLSFRYKYHFNAESEFLNAERVIMFYGEPNNETIKNTMIKYYGFLECDLLLVGEMTKKQYKESRLIEVGHYQF